MLQTPNTAAEPIVVNLTPPEVTVAAGAEPVEIQANLRNAGTTVDQYSLEIENLDPSWYTITVQSVSLFPGDSAPIPIRLHPPKASTTRAGHYTFVVRARSHADPTLVGVTKGVVTVGSYSIFQLDLAPKRVTGRKGNFRLGLSNGGNSELQVELSGRDPESALSYGFKHRQPTVQTGTKDTIPFTVKEKGIRLVGQERRHQFSIIARPVDGDEKDAREVTGEFVHKPMMASWKAPLWGLAILALLLAWIIFKPQVNPCSTSFLLPPNMQFYSGFACSAGVLKPFAPATPKAIEGSCQSGAGFTEVRNKYNDLIGGCVESEWYDDLGNAHQRTQNGQLLYVLKSTGTANIYFIRNDNSIYTFVKCSPAGTFNNCTTVELKSPNPQQ